MTILHDPSVALIDATATRLRSSPVVRMPEDERVDATVSLAESLVLAAQGDVSRLAQSAALSMNMTRWGVQTTFGSVTREELHGWLGEMALQAHRSVPVGLLGVILSGNVLTSPARGLLLPLLMGVPVLARVSSRELQFAGWLHGVLSDGCPAMRGLADSLALLTFDHRPPAGRERLAALASVVDVISVYGSDATCDSVGAASASTRVLRHGHGLGVGVLPAVANTDDDTVNRVTTAFALDVAAYDQRGCLSPQALYVQENGWVSPEEVAARLLRALDELELTLPRGPLDIDTGGRQAQFRGVAAALGRLFEGRTASVSYEGVAPPRPSPGFRNIAVHSYTTTEDLMGSLSPLGRHLKCVGLAGTESHRRAFVDALPRCLTPRVCSPGQMQTPAFTSVWDGVPAWEGLVRYVAR